jgi:hypothetical protein
MRPQRIGWWVMALLLALSTPAAAHVTTDTPVDFMPAPLETLAAAAPSADGLGTFVAAMVAALILIARRRHAAAIACTALLLLLAFESGVHSVHHLADPPDSQCVVASASAHTGGVAVDTIAFEPPAETTTVIAFTLSASPTSRSAAPDLGRAPPIA